MFATGAQAQDTTAPGVTSIERHSPTGQYTNADSLTWRVTFSEAVRNVDTTDFSLVTPDGIAFPGTTALAVSLVSNSSVYDVTASGSGIENADNIIKLVFASGHNIEDSSGNALPASPTVSGTNSDSFTLDNTAPTVVSIERQMPTTSMTDADSLTWRVTFNDAGDGYVTSVDAADFQIDGTTAMLGIVDNGDDSYDVTASGGDLANLNATVTLSFANNHDISDDTGNRLASTTPTSGTNDNTFEVQNVVIDPGAPEVVSIKRHAQEVRNLGTSLVWRVEFDKHLPNVYASDFTLSGTTAGLDVRHDLSNYDPKTYKTVVFVYAQGGDLETVSGAVTLSIASNHNIVDFEGRRLASTTPTETNDNTFTLNPNETLVYFTQENYYVDEGNEAVLTLRLSRLRDTATTISALSATPLTATGNGVDYHGQTYSVTIPAYRASGTLRIRTSEDTLTEDEETFRVDIHGPLLPAGVAVTTAPGATGNDGQTYVNIRDEDTATAKANKEPDLVFDNAHLTWNEADGCTKLTNGTGPGPFYHVKLKKQPLGPVEVWIKDPDDDYRSDYVAKGRLYVANTNHTYWKYTHTKLYFTPGNWDQYQRVNVKIKCADHYTAQIPIVHRLYTNYIGDKGKLSHAYPGYSGVLNQTWSVHVRVHESDPPIVVKGLPQEGQTIAMDEGSHKDFEITLSESAFVHHSRLPVYLSARGGKAAGVKRRDGRAQSCGGPLDDCLYFTPSNRTQWVRLFAINPGRDELKVEIPQLLWGNLGDLPLVRDWEMRWPVEVSPVGQGAPAQSAAAPTQAVSNLQVTAIDAVSASVTWNAVEHARFYEVSWEAQSSDKQTVIIGIESVAGTSTTIQHNAQEDMTLTVTVTPEYVDGNGITQRMEAFAATATLEVGPGVQELGSGGGTNGGDGGSIDAGFGAVDLPVPVSHWRFEDDAVDWVGSSHGTEKGSVAFEANEEGEGVESYALSLDGTDDYVDLASHVSDFPLGDSTRSITGWFKADTGNQRQTFFTYGPNVEGKRFSIAADRTQVLVAVSGHAWGVNGLELAEGWHHIAVTYAGGDSDDILIYLDGELQSASTLVGSPQRIDTQTGPSSIGRNVGATKHYTGLIDDVRLYDVALSAEQVLVLFEEHPQTVLAEDNPDDEPSDQSIEADDEEVDDVEVDLPDPVAHWGFDNDAVDGAGLSDGTVSGGAAFVANEDGEGVGSHALSLDGSNDYVDLDLHVSKFPLGNSTRSVSGWFKADTGNQGQSFFSYGPNVAGKRFSIAADRTQAVVGVSGYAWGVRNLSLTDGWHHIAVTFAGGDAKVFSIYLDGVLQSSELLGGFRRELDTKSGPASIGRSATGTKHYAGSIDDLRLYDVELSAEQVRALFDEHPQL